MADRKNTDSRKNENESDVKSQKYGQIWKLKMSKEEGRANPCIWMQSGAVKSKSCNNYYNCITCSYDLGMKKRVDSGKQISWQDMMRRRPGLERICRHSLTNRIPKRACAYDYNCQNCDFDQLFEDTWNSKTGTTPNEVQMIKGFEIPAGHYFHDGHSWARIESGGLIRVGLDDFALKLLGTADSFELPLTGKELTYNRRGWDIMRKEKLAGCLSPVSGTVVDVNSNILENPELANSEPYGEGWLLVVHTADIKGAFNKLMDEDNSRKWLDNEVEKLEGMITKVSGQVQANGEYMGRDIFGKIPELGWENLAQTFLKSQ